jgi:ribonuclease III
LSILVYPSTKEVRLLALEEKLHYQFRDKALLQLALCHKSFANEGRKKVQTKEEFVNLHNERLEFLGDSVLGLVISDLLSEHFPDADEGKLSKMRSSLVNEDTLANLARKLELGPHLLLGKGEESTQGRDKSSILSSSYEAILGAIYLDGGFSAAHASGKVHFAELIANALTMSNQHDTKTILQEICQSKFRKSPTYKVVSEIGPDHEKEFEVMVKVGNLERFGKGKNKKEAEQSAARFLLDHLSRESLGEVNV